MPKVKALKVGHSHDPQSDYGPLVTPESKARVLDFIDQGEKAGADVVVDGRGVGAYNGEFNGEDISGGYFVGPTLFDNVTTEMRVYQEEIFGPALCVIHVDTLEEAIELVNANPNGNGTSIFTRSGAAARKYQHETEVGQVGINVPIPVPAPFFSFTGSKHSFFGDLHAYGKQAVRFYTETKTVLSRWPETDVPDGPNMTINMK